MEPFLNVFWGILQNFQGAASGVNIWIRTITFTVKIVQTTTGISVIFIILSTVNILLDNFFTLLFTTSVIMFDKSNLIIILKYLMMLVKTILVLKHQKITNITTGDCMKLWPQQASGTAKFIIIFSNINKRIFDGFYVPIVLGLLNCICENHQN